MASYEFVKGHGTENDFVLLPDHDGAVHGGLDPARVRALCDRRAGIGGDGVLRVIRTSAMPYIAGARSVEAAEWFMDYRNADGSDSEMCGNGVRVFARHLLDEGLVEAAKMILVGTRDGLRTVLVEGELMTVDMGVPRLLAETTVELAGSTYAARQVDVGNPHAVAFVPELEALGTPLAAPRHDHSLFPDGVNVEFVVRRGERHVALRVYERGSGETRSCGTGACAVMAVAAAHEPTDVDVSYQVDVPGGTLQVTRRPDGRVLLTGPATVVARGVTDL